MRTLRPTVYVLAAVVVSVICVRVSLDPAAYFRYAHREDPWTYPTRDVAFIVGATLLEGVAVAFAFVAAVGRRLWPVSLCLLAILVPCLALGMMSVVHAPGYRLIHLFWLVTVVASLVATTVASAGVHVLTAVRARRARIVAQLRVPADAVRCAKKLRKGERQ